MRRLILTISCGLLPGGYQLYWTKPGATLADFTAGHQACLREVGVPTPGDPDSVGIEEAKRVRLDSIPEQIPWGKRN